MSVLLVIILVSRSVLTQRAPTPVNVVEVMSLEKTSVHAKVIIVIDGVYRNHGLLADINECRIGNHTCDQKCVNTNGSYSCDCSKGYTLWRDKRTCKGDLVMAICGKNYCKLI